MPDRPIRRRVKVAVGVTSALAVAALVATPALAHDSSTKKKGSKCQEMAGMDMCGNGVYHGKGGKATLKVGTMHVIDGALTGNSPCEKSGPPASVGQVKKDAEGHDHRGPLYQYPVSKADREQLIAEQTQARAVAEKYPTVASAEAAGYRKSTPYVPCIGAHYTNISLVAKFDPAAPSELLYDGTTPDAKIVGLSYLVLHPGGAPAGFAGPNDMWHQHNSNGGLCLNAQGVVVGNEATTPAECAQRGGRKAALNDIWMVHDWVVPGWECSWGVFAGECPELGGRVGGTAFDPPDPKAFKTSAASSGKHKQKQKSE
ncbi:MAG: hypothetical protein ACXVJ7_01240 [Acidimicrobiia bacterium]